MYKTLDIHNNDFFSFIDNVPDAIVITNNDGKIVLINPQTEKIFGYSQKELLGEPVELLMPARFHESHTRYRENYSNNPAIRPMGSGINIIGKRKDGSEVPLEISLSPWGNADEVLVISFIRDITERRRTENRLRKNKELEILHTVTDAVHKSIDLDEVYNVALDMAVELDNVDMAFIYLADRDREEAVLQAHRNLSEDYIRRAGRIPYPNGATWEVINTGKILNIENVQKGSKVGLAGRSLGHHGALGIPIIAEGEAIGVLWFLSYEEKKFEEEDVALLASIGNQIAIAIVRAKLYRNLSRKSKYEEIVRTVIQDVHSSLDLQEVLENAAQSMCENIECVDSDGIYMVEGEEAVLKAYRGLSDSFVERAGIIPHPKGFTWKTIIEGKPRYCADTEKDEYIGPAGKKEGIKSYLSMPIAYEDKTIGCININSKQRNALDEEELKLLEVVSRQISIAIRNAQQAKTVKESEERYRSLYDQYPVGVCLIDRDLKITHCNTSMIQIFQSSYEKVIGLDLHTLKDQTFVPVIEEAFKGTVGTLESPYRATTSPAGIWLSVKTMPLFDNENKVHSVMGVVEDITEHKRAEEALKRSEEKYRDLVNGINEGIFVHDNQGVITFANQALANIHGLKDPEEIVGRKFTEFISPTAAKDALEIFKKFMETENCPKVINSRILRSDGSEAIVEIKPSFVRDDSGRVIGVRGVLLDVTERKRTEEELVKTQKLESVGILAGGIAHDLNNMLTPIIMSLQLLRNKLNDDKSLKWIDTIETCAKRGAGLIQQILVFSKGTGGEKAPLQTSFLLSETNKILQDTIPKSIEISVGISNDLWNVMGESTQLQQVLMNLCLNARDAMPTGGTLKISAENLYLDRNYAQIHADAHPGPYVVITVSDTGTGIAPEVMDRMFEPFFTTKDPGRGTGLGLSTAYRIIKDHQGFITVQSKKGLGTEFKLYLPAIETNETKQAIYDYDKDTPKGNGELILIVDDEEAVRDITKLTLEAFGYKTIAANDGAEAVGIYAQNKDDIKAVILDMMMPIMEGSATIRALKKIDPDVKIIAVSGLIDTKAILTTDNLTVDAFLNKPYTSKTLIKTLKEVVRSTEK